MKQESREKSKSIAMGGVFLALSIASIFIGSFIPGIEMTVYAVASLAIFVFAMECGVKNAWILFAASLLLGGILVPNKLAIIPYALVFGLYPVLKCTLENAKMGKGLGYIIKSLYYVIAFVMAATVFKKLFLDAISGNNLPVVLIGILGFVMFLAYDGILAGVYAYLHARMYKNKKEEFDFTLSKDE